MGNPMVLGSLRRQFEFAWRNKPQTMGGGRQCRMWDKDKVRESLFIEHSAVRISDTSRTVHQNLWICLPLGCEPSLVRMFGWIGRQMAVRIFSFTYIIQQVSEWKFFFSQKSISIVDLGYGSFAPTAFHELVDGALAVAFELRQVLIKHFSWAKGWHQVIELAHFLGHAPSCTLLCPPLSLPLVFQLGWYTDMNISLEDTKGALINSK